MHVVAHPACCSAHSMCVCAVLFALCARRGTPLAMMFLPIAMTKDLCFTLLLGIQSGEHTHLAGGSPGRGIQGGAVNGEAVNGGWNVTLPPELRSSCEHTSRHRETSANH